MPDRKIGQTWRRRAGALILVILLLPAGYYLYVRYATTNFHVVVEGQVYRSAQPSPVELKRWTVQHGLKTVINLRGASSLPFYEAERSAAAAAGLQLVSIRFSAQRLPSALSLRRLIEALERSERPVLVHCQAGADRTGVASVLAAMVVGGESYETARGQLSAWYGHIDPDPEHIGGLLQLYERHCRERGTDTGGWAEFRQWALQEYRTYYYHVTITAPSAIAAKPHERIAVALTIRNTSGRTIPAGDGAKIFNVAAFTGSSEAEEPDREFGRTRLPQMDIPPGASVVVNYMLRAPRRAGTHTIHFDVIEEQRTWFARQGSPEATCTLTVTPAGGATSPAAPRPPE